MTGRAVTRVVRHLRVLARDIGARPPGSDANQRANQYIAGVLGEAGWAVRAAPFQCRTWAPGAALLCFGGRETVLEPTPFSRCARVTGLIRRFESAGQLALVEFLRDLID